MAQPVYSVKNLALNMSNITRFSCDCAIKTAQTYGLSNKKKERQKDNGLLQGKS